MILKSYTRCHFTTLKQIITPTYLELKFYYKCIQNCFQIFCLSILSPRQQDRMITNISRKVKERTNTDKEKFKKNSRKFPRIPPTIAMFVTNNCVTLSKHPARKMLSVTVPTFPHPALSILN